MPTGYYDKYFIRKRGDEYGVHDECEFFVLDMTHDVYALTAVKYYADAVRENNPELAADLDLRINQYCSCIPGVVLSHNCPVHGVT